jgi:hypothetical protein
MVGHGASGQTDGWHRPPFSCSSLAQCQKPPATAISHVPQPGVPGNPRQSPPPRLGVACTASTWRNENRNETDWNRLKPLLQSVADVQTIQRPKIWCPAWIAVWAFRKESASVICREPLPAAKTVGASTCQWCSASQMLHWMATWLHACQLMTLPHIWFAQSQKEKIVRGPVAVLSSKGSRNSTNYSDTF